MDLFVTVAQSLRLINSFLDPWRIWLGEITVHTPQFFGPHSSSNTQTTDSSLSWAVEPWVAVFLLLVSSVYLFGWQQLHRRLPSRFPSWRSVAFLCGLLAIALALSSPLDPLADELLQFHMIQHLLFMMVAPPLLWLGAPMLPLLRGLPRPVLYRGIAPLLATPAIRKLGRFLAHPLVCLMAFSVSTVGWHIPSLYELALRSEWWHEVQHISFFGTGLLFWWPVVQPWPARPRWPRWAMIPYLLFASIQNTALSAILIFSERVLYPSYAAIPRLWGIAALEDQAAAGAIMWVPGSVIMLIPLVVIAIRMLDSPHVLRATDPRMGYEPAKAK
ncbi:MAG: cytochrome c oxidase assembly protein [Deltaproteobacteria bacterium]|nr:cytochrome c oxidase assembly protein [Deltaproteobacteria bacterium]